MRPHSPTFSNPQAMRGLALKRQEQNPGHPLLSDPSVDRDTWLTPRYILQALGTFDLDPCAAAQNQNWTGARHVFTKDMDGLAPTSVWVGRVFCNPPFSDTRPWVERSAAHGRGILLIPAVIESRHWRNIVWPQAKVILILNGRPRFCNPDGSVTTGRPLRPVALIAWSDADAAVLEACQLTGVLLKGWEVK